MNSDYDWKKLFCADRRKDSNEKRERCSVWDNCRTPIERDLDRIVFSASTRRLANKTQVFPMEENDSIRTRLTHSYEVSNLARGAGINLCCNGFFDFSKGDLNRDEFIRNVPALLASIGLLHDMGNPPFGHQGEKAIRDWFCKKIKEENINNDSSFEDFKNFDGNAQTVRLVNRLHTADGVYGMNLTFATLAAMIKYPACNGNAKKYGYSKAGFFSSEDEVITEVWSKVGLPKGKRHPMTYVMEACDDIAYATIDAEDTIKKGYASYNDLTKWMRGNNKVKKIFEDVEEKIRSFGANNFITDEIENEVSVEIFRSLMINELLNAATTQFKNDFHSGNVTSCEENCYEIVNRFEFANVIKKLKNFSFHFGFKNKNVLRLELEGGNMISDVLNFIWRGIEDLGSDLEGKSHYEKYIVSMLSNNYIREFKRVSGNEDNENKIKYAKFQLMTDFISGMTEGYLNKFYFEVKPFYERVCNEQKNC